VSSDSETRVSLEVFHRHVLATHLKGNAARVLDHLERRAQGCGEPFGSLLAELVASYDPKPEWQEDEWYRREVPLDECYFACTDFRLSPVPKDQRFVDFLNDNRQKIESGCFPCSLNIRAPWSGQMPEPLVTERETGKYYVLDVQLCVIWLWYHQIPNVRVFIYRGKLSI
jgi:hypothetical protein